MGLLQEQNPLGQRFADGQVGRKSLLNSMACMPLTTSVRTFPIFLFALWCFGRDTIIRSKLLLDMGIFFLFEVDITTHWGIISKRNGVVH